MAKARTWIIGILAFLGICVVALLIFAGVTTMWVMRHISTAPASATSAVKTFDEERARFGAEQPLLKLDDLVHCVIPRGGEPLIRFVAENSTIPVIKHYKGVCFVYVDQAADLAMAASILTNAKVSRPSACNAVRSASVSAPGSAINTSGRY